jgi:hypothetical protein
MTFLQLAVVDGPTAFALTRGRAMPVPNDATAQYGVRVKFIAVRQIMSERAAKRYCT